LMNKQEADFLVELGDFKDQDDPPVEENTISYLQVVPLSFSFTNCFMAQGRTTSITLLMSAKS
ncbi:unnamed protein product, partial [marine sediment metagenome]